MGQAADPASLQGVTAASSEDSAPNKAPAPSSVPPTSASPDDTAPLPVDHVVQTSSSSEPSARAAPYGVSRENLEQEVAQVMGTLSSWWGGVRQQSVTALSSFKADLDKTVVQAQADFEQLRTAKVEIVSKDAEQFAAEQQAEKDRKMAKPGGDPAAETSHESFLNRLTSSTSQIQHNLQTTLQSTLAAAANNPALANATDLTNHLAGNLHLADARQNIQQSVKQAEKLAEEYLQRGDQLRKGAEKWMSEAIKVVPPGEQGDSGSGMSWDGSDWYAIVTQPASRTPADKPSTDSRPKTLRSSTSSRALAGSRKDALLARLREDKDLVLVDPLSPSTPTEQQQRYERWLSAKWPAQKEDMAVEAGMVGAVRMAVVPEHMTDDEFWQRYLYIRDTIMEEDEKRQQILRAHEQTEQEDFTWDDEPEAPAAIKSDEPPTPKSHSKEQLPPPVDVQPTSMPSTATSPRNSSEESYDVISDAAAKVQGDSKAPVGKTETAKNARTDDEDSDWE